MRFDTTIELDKKRANQYVRHLIEKSKTFDVTVKNKKRTVSQNRYMHLIFSWFGFEFGYTLQEVKQEIFKKHVNPEIFYNGEKESIVKIEKWRSTANLDTRELTIAIERFRDFSSKEGCYLPEPKDMASINEMERQLVMKSAKQYL